MDGAAFTLHPCTPVQTASGCKKDERTGFRAHALSAAQRKHSSLPLPASVVPTAPVFDHKLASCSLRPALPRRVDFGVVFL